MSKCGQVVQEGGGRCVIVHTYHKILENTVFLSVTPAFVYLLERGQHEHS